MHDLVKNDAKAASRLTGIPCLLKMPEDGVVNLLTFGIDPYRCCGYLPGR